MSKFSNTLAAAIALPADAIISTPCCCIDAIIGFQKNEKENFSQVDFVIMCNVLAKDFTACNIYNIFPDDQDVRKHGLIDAQLEQALFKGGLSIQIFDLPYCITISTYLHPLSNRASSPLLLLFC